MRRHAKSSSGAGETIRRWSIWRHLDRYVGRGSYRWLRRLDPRREYTQLIYARAVDHVLKPGVRWLDAGCGHQIFKIESSKEEEMVKRVRLALGCDVCYLALREHRSLTNRVCCKLEQLPFADDSFDLVTLNMVVEHLEKPEATFTEFARIVDSNGCLIIHTPNSASYAVRLVRLGRYVLPDLVAFRLIRYLEGRETKDVFPAFYRANTRNRLAELMHRAGMAEDKVLLLPDRPLFYFAAPLSALELLWSRLLFWLGWRELVGDNILGFYRPLPRLGSVKPEQNLELTESLRA